jgi:ubiquinone biosynthesis protein UbiJ
MLNTLQSRLGPLLTEPLAERLTLLLNHVLAAEPAATERLRPHAGRRVALAVSGWPALLPAPPLLAWAVTPAGLLQWAGAEAAATADLRLRLDASNPALLLARAVGGEAPPVQIEGDAQLAGDVNWLLQNLRWDAAADLEKLCGPAVAQQLVEWGRLFAAGLRQALQLAARAADSASQLGERLRARRA